MTALSEKTLFSLLPEKRPPWMQFLFSVSTQGLALCALTWMGVIYPAIMPRLEREYHFVQLIHQPIRNSLPAPLDALPTRILKGRSANTQRLPLAVQRETRRDDVLETPKVPFTEPKSIPLLPVPVAIPRQAVKLDVFSSETLTTTIAITPQTVQLGGFGNATGAVAEENKAKPIKISRLDSFDRPTQWRRDVDPPSATEPKKVTPSADFTNHAAEPDSNQGSTAEKISRPAGFDQIKPEVMIVHPKVTASSAPKTVSAQITLKPTPIYTDEARRLRIEGEVLLDVVFESRGKVRVVRVIRGLGYGLDQAAIWAAEKICFIPAQRGNQAVDFSAVLHILFRLA